MIIQSVYKFLQQKVQFHSSYSYSLEITALALAAFGLDLLRGVPCLPVLFDFVVALLSKKTHNITLKNLTLFRLNH